MRSPAMAVIALAMCYLASGCAWQKRHDVYLVVDAYCDAEVKGDLQAKYQHLAPESLEVLRGTGTGSSVVGVSVAPTPILGWGMGSYKIEPSDIAVKKEKAYAQVTATFLGPRSQRKNVTFTVYLKSYKEPKVGGGTETVWRVNEIETKYRLAGALVGQEYADLWMRQLKSQEEWRRATSPGVPVPLPGPR